MIHDSDHSHDHSHGHSHTHTHSHGDAGEMSLEQKLAKLVSHWIDHNDSHKQTFFTWAERAHKEGLTDVAAAIEKAGVLSEEVTGLLKQAESALKK